MEKNPDFCCLRVPDPEVARQAEAARITGEVVIDGDFYTKLAYIDASSDMTLLPVGAQLQVLKQTYRPAKPEDLLAEVSSGPSTDSVPQMPKKQACALQLSGVWARPASTQESD